MASRVWLIGVAVFVAAVTVVGLVVAIVTTRNEELLPADSPEGTVQRFLHALQDEDYEIAYSYLSATITRECTLEKLIQYASYRQFEDSRVTLDDTQQFDSRAIVTAEVTTFDPELPFDSEPEYSYRQTFELAREDGQWRITGPRYECPTLY